MPSGARTPSRCPTLSPAWRRFAFERLQGREVLSPCESESQFVRSGPTRMTTRGYSGPVEGLGVDLPDPILAIVQSQQLSASPGPASTQTTQDVRNYNSRRKHAKLEDWIIGAGNRDLWLTTMNAENHRPSSLLLERPWMAPTVLRILPNSWPNKIGGRSSPGPASSAGHRTGNQRCRGDRGSSGWPIGSSRVRWRSSCVVNTTGGSNYDKPS